MTTSRIPSLRSNPLQDNLDFRDSRPEERPKFTTRVSSYTDNAFYGLYSFLNPAPLRPKTSGDPQKVPVKYSSTIILYQDARKILESMPLSQRQCTPGAEKTWETISNYDDRNFRLSQAQLYFDLQLSGKCDKTNTLEYKNKSYWTHFMCSEELDHLYAHGGYREKYQVMLDKQNLFLQNFSPLNDEKYNEQILIKHRQKWASLSASERVKKICCDGTRSRYVLLAAGVTATTIAILVRESI